VDERRVSFRYEKAEEERLDVFLAACMPEFSRARLQGLIKDGCVSVDGAAVTKPGRTLSLGAQVEARIPPRAPSGLVAEAIPLDILFENDDLVVVNKPAGMVVHPSPGHGAGTLVHAVLAHVPGLEGIGGEDRPGVVHRLDKDTSGLILLAKNERAHRWLQDQFRLRIVEKTYLALVDGAPPTPSGRVEAPLGRDPAHRKKMTVLPPGKGREAASDYRTLERFAAHTLLEVHPLTGRTHQIRLHLAFLGCPIVGDRVYGRRQPTLALNRHFLHACRLKIVLPGEAQARQFEAGLPGELLKVLEEVRRG
jgi:23S rRNA pseudouridine1911/1915/1917 synthase